MKILLNFKAYYDVDDMSIGCRAIKASQATIPAIAVWLKQCGFDVQKVRSDYDRFGLKIERVIGQTQCIWHLWTDAYLLVFTRWASLGLYAKAVDIRDLLIYSPCHFEARYARAEETDVIVEVEMDNKDNGKE
jgi:hypothetical protein